MLKKAVTKYSFLVGSAILIALFLVLTVGPGMSGTFDCKILPTQQEERDLYCSTCGNAYAFCDIKPTLGISGCQCAEDFCAKWIDNDVCDWSRGIHVCKAVCNDVVNMPTCSQVAAHGAVSSTGTPIGPFPFTCCGYVPTGGCCDENSDCATGKCNGFSAACPRYKSCTCSNENGQCMSDKDCCPSMIPIYPPIGLTCNLNPTPSGDANKKICTLCAGRVYESLSKYTANTYETVTAYISGLDTVKCNGRPITLKMNDCNGGTEITKCNYNNKYSGRTECPFSIGKAGAYNIFACADLNGDGYYSDTESAMATLNVINSQPTTIRVRRGSGGSRWAIPLETSGGLNDPLVILVALIAIVVIIYGAFKFFAMPKKHR
jgi:hypothetical protein